MTPETLRYLREQRGLTREQLAEFLGDCTASTINKWERDMHAIPAWVEDKMLRSLPVTLPLDELYLLLDEAHTTGRSAATLISEALRLWLEQNKSSFKSASTIPAYAAAQPCANSAASTSPPLTSPPPDAIANIVSLPPPPVVATLLHDTLHAAETPTTPPVTEPRQPVTYPKPPRKKNK